MQSVTHKNCAHCSEWKGDFYSDVPEAIDEFLLNYAKHLEESHPDEWQFLTHIENGVRYIDGIITKGAINGKSN